MSISNCPGIHATDAVDVAVAVDVGVDDGVAVTTGVVTTGSVVGSVLVTVGDGDPHAATAVAIASSTVGTNTRRIATQRTRNPGSTLVNERSAGPGPH
jgi:hypothetical protein